MLINLIIKSMIIIRTVHTYILYIYHYNNNSIYASCWRTELKKANNMHNICAIYCEIFNELSSADSHNFVNNAS